jgi:NAD(P)-dependent dehydrogenase (short-subunit alcohol dehydrogenase family)
MNRSSFENKLASKTVVVTEGNAGLGFACARSILSEASNSWNIILACLNPNIQSPPDSGSSLARLLLRHFIVVGVGVSETSK